jgi:hypothetical protein
MDRSSLVAKRTSPDMQTAQAGLLKDGPDRQWRPCTGDTGARE